jgi:hypothetical protein
MSIYASDGGVPVEFDFTEFVGNEKPLSSNEVKEFLGKMHSALFKKAKIMSKAFEGFALHVTSAIFSKDDLQRVIGSTRKEKGIKLEEMIQTIFSVQEGFEVKKNLKRSDQEIDLVVINRIKDPFWTALQSPLILIECRNRRGKFQAKDIRDFEIKLQNYSGMCRLGIVISTSGFTKECFTVAMRCSREIYRILLIGKQELENRVENPVDTRTWLENLILEQS